MTHTTDQLMSTTLGEVFPDDERKQRRPLVRVAAARVLRLLDVSGPPATVPFNLKRVVREVRS